MVDDFDAVANYTHAQECWGGRDTGTCQITRDMAGLTIHGISELNHPSAWAGKIPSVDDYKAILRSAYWTPLNGDKLPWPLNLALVDFAYHSGNKRAVRGLQSVLGVHADGRIGPVTLGALEGRDPLALARELTEYRRDFLEELCERDPVKYGPYRRGWLRRIDRLLEKIG